MPRWKRLITTGALCAFALTATASPSNEKAVQACISDAAAAFHVPALPVRILRKVEAGQVGMASPNTNGSVDLGPMQVNSSWLPMLKRLGITRDQVQYNPCVNAYVGTWIFAQAWADSRAQPAMAMARYHSPNPAEQARYLGLVLKAIDRQALQLADHN